MGGFFLTTTVSRLVDYVKYFVDFSIGVTPRFLQCTLADFLRTHRVFIMNRRSQVPTYRTLQVQTRNKSVTFFQPANCTCREAGFPGQRCDKPDSHGRGGALLASKLFLISFRKGNFLRCPKFLAVVLSPSFSSRQLRQQQMLPLFSLSVFLLSVKQVHASLYTHCKQVPFHFWEYLFRIFSTVC
jgi:hypothetical protein